VLNLNSSAELNLVNCVRYSGQIQERQGFKWHTKYNVVDEAEQPGNNVKHCSTKLLSPNSAAPN
jgi:hypothetical protein